MDYANPMQMFQNVNPVPNNPFWSGMMGARNQMAAQPFMDQMHQNNAYDLQKKGMETGEFVSQEAQDVRSQQRRGVGAESQYKIDTLPTDARNRNMESNENMRALPHVTDAKIEQAKSAIMNAKSAPARALMTELGQLSSVLETAPEQERPHLYLSAMQRWQMAHPGVEVPPQFKMYDPRILPDLAAIRHAQIYTPQQMQKEREIMLQGDERVRNTRIEGNDSVRRALIGYNSSVDSASVSHSRENPPQAVARLRRELAANPKQPAKVEEYKSHLDDQWNKSVQTDPGLSILRMQSMMESDKKRREELEEQYETRRWQFFAEKGVYLNRKYRVGGKLKEFKYTGDFGGNFRDQKSWTEVR
jgi:hypothetical protein